MTKQVRKNLTGLAGEFLVAGELLRRGVMAVVTYGNAKKADVIAVSGSNSVVLEVKSTSQTKWVLGGKLPADDDSIWVLVYLPLDERISPRYYVLTSAELLAIVLPAHEAYGQRYLVKHGREYDKKGVVSVKQALIDDIHQGAWNVVLSKLKA